MAQTPFKTLRTEELGWKVRDRGSSQLCCSPSHHPPPVSVPGWRSGSLHDLPTLPALSPTAVRPLGLTEVLLPKSLQRTDKT